MPVQQQPMTPMPFYADPNRFPTPVWQTDPSQVSGWQGQFIQQIPTAAQPIDTYQQYPNGIYQTTYQQPAFESNTFYTGAVQVLTPANARPPSAPNQQAQMIPQRPNSNYAHTPSPGPAGQQAQQQNQQQQPQQQQNSSRQYQEYNQFGSNTSNEGSQSRPSSVNSVINQNPATPNANYNQGGQQTNQTQQQQQQQQTVYTTVSAANFSPSSNQQQTQFVSANSGNGQPGYPQVNASSPQVVSHNSSGYSGNEQFSGQQNHQQWQQQDHQQIMWEQQQQQVQENKMEQQNYQQQTEQQNNHVQYNMASQQKDHSVNNSPTKMQNDNIQRTFSQADKVNLNTRIKTMILNKQQNDAKMEQDVKNVEQNNTTGHFLWYSHHHHLNPLSVDGGPPKNNLPNHGDNSLVNISSNNTQIFAQSNFKQPNIKENSNELSLRMQRPLQHNNKNYSSYFIKKETDQSRSIILNKNADFQLREKIGYSNVGSKELVNQPASQQHYESKGGIQHSYSITSQSQPSIIGKEMTYQQTDFNGHQKVNSISASRSSELVYNTGSSLNKKQDITNKFHNTLNQESRYAYHHSTRTYTLQDNYVNQQPEQNKTPQSPSVSSVNSPANKEEMSSSKLNESNSISSQIQNTENKTPFSQSVVANVGYTPLIHSSSCSPSLANDPQQFFAKSESQISSPKTLPVCSPNSYPKTSSNIYGMETSNIGLASPPFYSKAGNSESIFPSQISNSRDSGIQAESYSQNIITSFKEPYIADNKALPSSHFTSIANSSKSNGSPQRSANEVSSFNLNKEEKNNAPEKASKEFCSPSSSDQVKSRLANKPDKSPPKIIGEEIPQCHCFPPDQSPPEPGTYYTHLGCANNLRTLRHNLEHQTGSSGPAIRIEKVRYTNKEGKTAQGCPIVKWVHRRVNLEEKYLVIVKQRSGHICQSAFIVIAIVVWEGISQNTSNDLYSFLPRHLNKFGIPTKRRCSTNDPRTCACQGINEDFCGASFTFGCSWSMYYNGCKYTRSKDVRKFRLSVKEEEKQIEEMLQNLADQVSPVYKAVAPQSFINQTKFEHVASECRLGTKPGRPFSGVTACMDFCAHAHKDIHNMNDGCTVVVTLTKHRGLLAKPNEEQYHVLPLFVPDDTDEFGSKENQEMKVRTGEIEILSKYECEIRTFSEPAEKCRNRRDKKEGQRKRKSATPAPSSPSVSSTTVFQQSPKDTPSPYNSSEIQSGQVSSTVIDSPIRNANWRYDNFNNNSENSIGVHSNGNNYFDHLPQFSVFKTPYSYDQGASSNSYNQDSYASNCSYSSNNYPSTNKFQHPTPNLFSHYINKDTQSSSSSSSSSSYTVSNPFDDMYLNNTPPLPPPPTGSKAISEAKPKSVEISYTSNSECFTDPAVGGVAIALTHGSILFECAKHELHATTALKTPDRTHPTRLSLVFYQHRSLNKAQHGLDEYTLKQKSKLNGVQSDIVDFDSSLENSSLNSSLEGSSGEVNMRTATLPTYSMTTMFPMYPCMVTGPYQEHYGGTLSMPNK